MFALRSATSRALGYGGREFVYRVALAALFASPTFALLAFWFSFGTYSLGTTMTYLTLIPYLIAVLLAGTSIMKGNGPVFVRRLGLYGLWSLLPYALYDWTRVPFNYFFGLPFWDHFFDWGLSIMGLDVINTFSFPTLTTGMLTHILRGWGYGMVYYILAQKPTLRSAFLWVWILTIFYWAFFPTYVLVDSRPPFIWWFVAYLSHMVMAVGLWLTPKLYHRLFY